VGDFVSDFGTSPLGETWDGSTWTIQSVADPPDGRGVLLAAVSCPAPGACTAVGTYDQDNGDPFGGSGSRPLVAVWNGTAWTTQPTPTPPEGAVDTGLSGISCTAPTSCTAVGTYENVTTRSDGGALVYSWISDHAIAQQWDGASWSNEAIADPVGAPFIAVNGVACSGPTACVSVGSYSFERPAVEPDFSLVERTG
jgi:hypothetical protein